MGNAVSNAVVEANSLVFEGPLNRWVGLRWWFEGKKKRKKERKKGRKKGRKERRKERKKGRKKERKKRTEIPSKNDKAKARFLPVIFVGPQKNEMRFDRGRR